MDLEKKEWELNYEYIICAANHYDDGIEHVHQPKNIKTGFVICGQRHHNCIYTFSLIYKELNEETYKIMNTEIQGFLTNTNRFVDRLEALEITKHNGRLLHGEPVNEKIGLYSENLY